MYISLKKCLETFSVKYLKTMLSLELSRDKDALVGKPM